MTEPLRSRERIRWLVGVVVVACLLVGMGGAAASESQAAPPSNSKLMWLRIYDAVNTSLTDKKTSDDQICDAIGHGVLNYFFVDYKSWWEGTRDGQRASAALERASGKHRLCNWFSDSGRNGLTKAYPSILVTHTYVNRYIVRVRFRVLKDKLEDIYNAAKCGTSVSLMTKALLPFRLGRISRFTLNHVIEEVVC